MCNETVELLKECNSGCKMGLNSIRQVMEFTEDKKLKDALQRAIASHEKLEAEIGKQLHANGMKEESPGLMASAMSWISTEMKMVLKGSTHEVAKIMMDGCNMGIQSICEYKNKYKNASPESQKLAEDIIRTEENFMKEMKQFL